MFLSALSVLSEGRGEPGELGFSALEKYRRESRFCPGFGIIWPRFSSGPWILALFLASLFTPPPLHPTPTAPHPPPSFLIPSSFSNAIMPRSYVSRCRVRAGIDLWPPRMKTRGGPFSPLEWVILYREAPCSIAVDTTLLSVHRTFFPTLKGAHELRGNVFQPVSRRFAILYHDCQI